MSEIGKLSKELFAAKRKKADLNAQLKVLNAEIKDTEIQLLSEMEGQNLHKIGTAEGTIYRSRQVRPHVVDWDAFYEYIQKHGYFHMLERRPAAGAYREEYEQGIQIPGVDPLVYEEVRTRKS